MLRGMPRLFVPGPEIEPVPPAVETPSLHHWAVREGSPRRRLMHSEGRGVEPGHNPVD